MQTAGAWCRGHEDPSAWSQGKNICSVILLWLIRNTSPAVNIGAGGLSATFPKTGKGVIKKSLGVISVNY